MYRNTHPSHDAGPLSDLRQSTWSLTGSGLPSRGRCCRPIGRSCDGESRDVAPAASSDAPTRCGSPRARSSAHRSTIRTSDPDRVRPAGSLNRGQPRHAATRERSGSRSYAQRPTHGREATRVRMWPGRLNQVLAAYVASATRVQPAIGPGAARPPPQLTVRACLAQATSIFCRAYALMASCATGPRRYQPSRTVAQRHSRRDCLAR